MLQNLIVKIDKSVPNQIWETLINSLHKQKKTVSARIL